MNRSASPPTLSDGDLVLRAWAASDADAVLAACQDPELQHWLPVPVPYLADHAEGFVTDFATDQWASGRGAWFACADRGSGRLLGSFGLKDVDGTAGTAEVGYWVAPWARGRGVARRGARLLTDWAARDLGLRRLEFLVEPANAASCAVAAGLGAVVEALVPAGVVRRTPRDAARYVLFADQRPETQSPERQIGSGGPHHRHRA